MSRIRPQSRKFGKQHYKRQLVIRPHSLSTAGRLGLARMVQAARAKGNAVRAVKWANGEIGIYSRAYNKKVSWRDPPHSAHGYDSKAIEPDDEIEVPPTLFHATPNVNLDIILKEGLKPQHGYLTKSAGSATGKPKVYLGMQTKTNIYATMIKPMSFLKDNAMLAVSTEGLELEPLRNTAGSNKGYFQNEFTTTKTIPPENIKFIYSMDGEHAEKKGGGLE